MGGIFTSPAEPVQCAQGNPDTTVMQTQQGYGQAMKMLFR